MPKLLSKFYKLSESWLKTAEIASGVYLTVFNHGHDGDGFDDDDDYDYASFVRYLLAYLCLCFTLFGIRSFQNCLRY